MCRSRCSHVDERAFELLREVVDVREDHATRLESFGPTHAAVVRLAGIEWRGWCRDRSSAESCTSHAPSLYLAPRLTPSWITAPRSIKARIAGVQAESVMPARSRISALPKGAPASSKASMIAA